MTPQHACFTKAYESLEKCLAQARLSWKWPILHWHGTGICFVVTLLKDRGWLLWYAAFFLVSCLVSYSKTGSAGSPSVYCLRQAKWNYKVLTNLRFQIKAIGVFPQDPILLAGSCVSGGRASCPLITWWVIPSFSSLYVKVSLGKILIPKLLV